MATKKYGNYLPFQESIGKKCYTMNMSEMDHGSKKNYEIK